MTFRIFSIELSDPSLAEYEIVMEGHKERVPLITTLWKRDRYELQWKEALTALVMKTVDCCALVTDIQPLESSFGISYWALFREGERVILQDRFSREAIAQISGPVLSAAQHIPPRIQGTPEEQAEISEWEIDLKDVSDFLGANR